MKRCVGGSPKIAVRLTASSTASDYRSSCAPLALTPDMHGAFERHFIAPDTTTRRAF
jgi:hypothetical protein